MRARLTAVAFAFGIAAGFAIAPSQTAALGTASPELRVAYIDPGSGSFVLQALIAAVAGAAVAINAYWRKIKAMLGFGSAKTETEETDSDSTHA